MTSPKESVDIDELLDNLDREEPTDESVENANSYSREGLDKIDNQLLLEQQKLPKKYDIEQLEETYNFNKKVKRNATINFFTICLGIGCIILIPLALVYLVVYLLPILLNI